MFEQELKDGREGAQGRKEGWWAEDAAHGIPEWTQGCGSRESKSLALGTIPLAPALPWFPPL